VEFYSPLNNLSDFTEPAQVVLSLQTYQQNITLADYTNQTVGALSGMALQLSENQTQAPISVRSSEPVTLAGYPGHRITYTILDSQTQASFVTMQLWTVVDGNKVYTVTYGAEGNDKFMTHLPDATQMINSLGIANSTATT
jgi:hypothetical protein